MSVSCDPMDYGLPAPLSMGLLQARILEWVAIFFSRGSSQPRDQTWVSCIAGRFFTNWAMKEALIIWWGDTNYEIYNWRRFQIVIFRNKQDILCVCVCVCVCVCGEWLRKGCFRPGVWEDLSEVESSELSPDWQEGASPAHTRRKSVAGRRNN